MVDTEKLIVEVIAKRLEAMFNDLSIMEDYTDVCYDKSYIEIDFLVHDRENKKFHIAICVDDSGDAQITYFDGKTLPYNINL